MTVTINTKALQERFSGVPFSGNPFSRIRCCKLQILGPIAAKDVKSSTSSLNSENGFTLIELMISLAIGSIVLLGTTVILTLSAETRSRVSGSKLIQEEATFVTQILQQQLSQIAYRGIDFNLLDSRIVPIPHYAGVFVKVDGQWDEGQMIKADATSVTFRINGSSDSSGNPDESITTCTGETVGQNQIIETELFLLNGQLVCTTDNRSEILAGSTNADRVENIYIEIGVDSDGDSKIDTVIPATTATQNDFSNARLVRLRVLLASADRVLRTKRNYQFNGQSIMATDFRVREEVVVAVATRN